METQRDIKTSQVRKYIFEIQRLNPRPLSGYTGGTEQYMHVSTISRAVKGKYIQYPGGTIGMRDIFNNTQTFGNQDTTTEEIKKEIKRLIKAEDKKKPFSDSKIASLLEEKDQKISRRTVAKYRAQLGIAGMMQRKEI